jgi:hypothetical protein
MTGNIAQILEAILHYINYRLVVTWLQNVIDVESFPSSYFQLANKQKTECAFWVSSNDRFSSIKDVAFGNIYSEVQFYDRRLSL